MSKDKAILIPLVLLVVFISTSAFSQGVSPRIGEPIDNSVVVRMSGSHHPLARAANDRGRADGNLAMERMVLLLKPSDEQSTAINRLINQQHDRQSTTYHSWLTPEQYGAQFGPAEQDLNQVTAWLEQQGFRIDAVARGKQWVEFSGNVSQVELAFHTEMHHYLVNGKDHIANARDISLPRALAPVVGGVLSLHDFRKHATHAKAYQLQRDAATGKLARVAELAPAENGVAAKSSPDFSLNASTHFLTPGDYSRIYNTLPLLKAGVDGTGLSIAIVGRTDINLSDVQAFRQIFGLPVNDPTFIVNGLDPGVNGDEVESALDVEWSGAVAPKAAIKFVTSMSTFTTDGVDLSTSYIVDNVVAPIMSTSYGLCEAFLGSGENAFYNSIYRQAAAEGITVFVSAGDNGPAGCDFPEQYTPAQNGLNVSGLASTPYNVAVGGTQFTENGQDSTYWLQSNRKDLSSAVGYIPEAVWNESCDPTQDPNLCYLYLLWSGSGGASSCEQSSIDANFQITCLAGYPKPSWQAGIGVVDDGVRDLPDLSLAAAGGHDGYLICLEGYCQWTVQNGRIVLQNAAVVGGTSASAPSMAGMMALVEQKNGAYQGLANYSLYQIAAAENLAGCNSSNLTDPHTHANCVFNDVTAGNNNVPGQTGFNAVTGYDMASGLGTVNASNLVNAWSSVQKLGSETNLSAPSNTVQHGTPLTLNVAVQPLVGAGSPSGDFSVISDKYGSVFGGALSNGSFSGGVNGLAGGHYNIKAHYGGDAMFSGSNSASVPVTVTPEPSLVQTSGWEVNLAGFVVPIFGPVNYGQPVAIQFNVGGKSGVGSATGKATVILDDTTKVGTFPLNQGGSGWVEVDNIAHTGLVPGSHRFKVQYEGDNSFQPSLSAGIGVAVRKALPNAFVAPIGDSVTVGTPVRLQLFVLADGVVLPTGTVNVYDNGKQIAGPLTLTHNGPFGVGPAQLSYTVSNLKVGGHELNLSYSGDSNFLPLPLYTFSNHGGFVTVNPATGAGTRVQLTQSSASVTIGGTVNYSIAVRPAKVGGPTPTGTVTLVGENGGPFTDPLPLVNGSAGTSITWTFIYKEGITAAYSGDANYGASNSPVIVTAIVPGTPTVTLTPAASQVAAGTQTSLTVTTFGSSNPDIPPPYGEVVFIDVANGVQRSLGSGFLTTGNGGNPIFTLPAVLSAGTHVIHVRYRGGYAWNPADSNTVTVVAQ